MRYMTLIEAMPGVSTGAIRAMKHMKIPEGITITGFYGIFGKYDAMILFECDNEVLAAEFVTQFGDIGKFHTSVMFPLEEMRWTK